MKIHTALWSGRYIFKVHLIYLEIFRVTIWDVIFSVTNFSVIMIVSLIFFIPKFLLLKQKNY